MSAEFEKLAAYYLRDESEEKLDIIVDVFIHLIISCFGPWNRDPSTYLVDNRQMGFMSNLVQFLPYLQCSQ
jgi:hypothetical protein